MLVPYVNDKKGNTTDIFSRLLEDRIIMLTGEVTEEMALMAVSQLLYLDSLSHDEIKVYINSVGGSVYDGLAIYDTMQAIKSPVITICTGLAASMGAFLLAGGDKRYSLPNGQIMIHQVSSGTIGQCTDIQIAAKNVQDLKELLTKLLAENSLLTYDEMYAVCERDCWLTPEQAYELGLIDHIIGKAEKELE